MTNYFSQSVFINNSNHKYYLFFIYLKIYDCYYIAVNWFLIFLDFSCFEHKKEVKNRYKHVMQYVFF